MISARIDVFLQPFLASRPPSTCVFPITLWELDALRHFMSDVRGPVNIWPRSAWPG